jgi:hypothetical protein
VVVCRVVGTTVLSRGAGFRLRRRGIPVMIAPITIISPPSHSQVTSGLMNTPIDT